MKKPHPGKKALTKAKSRKAGKKIPHSTLLKAFSASIETTFSEHCELLSSNIILKKRCILKKGVSVFNKSSLVWMYNGGKRESKRQDFSKNLNICI